MELSDEQRKTIVMETMTEFPVETVGKVALLKISQMAIDCNSENTTFSTEATFNNKRYELKMLVTWKEIK